MINEQLMQEYKIGLKNCYRNTKKIVELSNKEVFLRDEESSTSTTHQYIIELSSPTRKNSDDYGIVVDFFFEKVNEGLKVEIDVLKSFGPIYFSKTFEIQTTDNIANLTEVENSLNWINSLPETIVKTYLQDYSG
jgi:hypothetical protein